MINIIIPYIISLCLLAIELLYETRYGDKHDTRSSVILGLFTLTSFLTNSLFIYVGLRILLFDYLFNIGWDRPWYYLGSTSKWDLILKKFNPYLILLAKIIVCVLFIWINYLIFPIF